MQAQAQSLVSQITFGIGWLVGATAAGKFVDMYLIEGGGHDWSKIWLYPMVMVAAIGVFFMIAFKDKVMVSQD